VEGEVQSKSFQYFFESQHSLLHDEAGLLGLEEKGRGVPRFHNGLRHAFLPRVLAGEGVEDVEACLDSFATAHAPTHFGSSSFSLHSNHLPKT